MERRLAAILAADVVGYSKLMGADEAGTLTALRRFRRDLLAPAIDLHKGNLVKSMGDGWLVEFSSAGNAVACAIQLQEGLADNEVIKLRIGVHVGDVTFEEEDIFGDGVNIAARLQSIAAPGAIVVSDIARRAIDGKIAADFADLGEQTLKNIAEKVRAFAWGGRAAPARTGQRRKPTVALGEFKANGGADAEALAEGVKAGVATSLSNQTGVDLISDAAQADFVVSATFQAHGDRYRATSRILNRATGSHFAAERFDGGLDDPFAAEDDLAYRVYNSVRFGLHRWEQEVAPGDAEPEDTDESRILEAGKLMFRPYIEDFNEAGRLLDVVVANAPGNFMALAMKASSLCGEFFGGYRRISENDGRLALQLARGAVRLNGNSDYAHWILSMALLLCDEDHAAAEAEARISLELNPYYAFATMGLALVFIASGRVDEGIGLTAKVATSAPRSQLLFWALQSAALGHLVAGRYGDALDWARRSDRRQADVARTLVILAAAAALDRDDRAVQESKARLMARYPDFRISDFGNWPFKDPETGNCIVEGLRLAGFPD